MRINFRKYKFSKFPNYLGVSSYTPNCGPLTVPMIVPYWADVDTRYYGGSVFYRESRDPADLAKAKVEVQRAFPGLTNLALSWMFIATWENVPFFGASTGNCSSPNIKNTFQTILVTDGSMSFAMFFYNKLQWTTGTASGGNCQGLGGVPAKAGFDTGDGTNFYSLPGSCSPTVTGSTETSNVNSQGKWIFRVDQANIVAPVTTTTTTSRPTSSSSTMRSTNNTTNGTQCDASSCVRVGHCHSYSFCNHVTRRWDYKECSDGLFWNPYSGYVLSGGSGNWFGNGTMSRSNGSSPVQCTGSCDLWNNLSRETQNLYRSDTTCFPECYFEPLGACSSSYRYHPQGTDRRGVKIVQCPYDSRPEGRFRQLVWVQEKESCDFCYNARSSFSGNGTQYCCSNYSGGNGTNPIGNGTVGGFNPTWVPAPVTTFRTTTAGIPAAG